MGTAAWMGLVVCFVLAMGLWVALEYRRFGKNQETEVNIARAQAEAVTARKDILGYTRYAEYLPAAKQALAEQLKSFVAKVERESVHIETIQVETGKTKSESSVVVRYLVTYTFGFDNAADALEVTGVASGITIKVAKPVLVLAPLVRPLSHEVPGKGIPTDEQMAVIDKLPALSEKQGAAKALDDAVLALLERKLVEFVREFLARQTGVKQVPVIAVAFQ